MRIQRRITLGIGILFTMILLLGIQSVGYVRQLSRATGTILADNYNSLQYAGEMLRSLNDIGQDSISRHALRENLALQQQNITEISEKETTAALERHVASLSDPVTEAEIRTVREDLFRIMELNMAAIRAKSAGVEQRADYAMWWLIAVAALCALIAGGILVWFPQSVLRPIDALKKGITQIANHNSYKNSYQYLAGNAISQTRQTYEGWSQTNRLSFQAHVDYNKSFGDHNLSAMAGYDFLKRKINGMSMTVQGAESDKTPTLGAGTTPTAWTDTQTPWCQISYFGRLNYNYKEKYMLGFTMRADGSSLFAKDNRWGYFPSVSAGWVVSEEKFWNVEKFNQLKLRLSYGLTGNNNVDYYDTLGAYSVTGIYAGSGATLASTLPNLGLTWEKTKQFDIGLDMAFFNNRLRVAADYYSKKSEDLLFDVSLPDTSGYGSAMQNVGSIRFYGLEFEISSVNVSTKNFSWTTDFTYSFNANKVLSLPDEYYYKDIDGKDAWRIGGYTMSESGYRFGGTAVGEPLGRIYGYKTSHIIESEAQADAALYDSNSHGYRRSDGLSIAGRKDVGDYEWKNRAGSALTADGREQINGEDMFLLGNVVPHSTGGMNNTFKFKNLTLSVYLDYALGHSIYNYQYTRCFQTSMGNCNWNLVYDALNTWQKPGDDTKFARLTPNDADGGNRNYSRISNINVQKADYLCLRDVTLSYDLPLRWIRKVGLGRLTVSVSGNTLCYWTGVKGISPESASVGSSTGMYSVTSSSATSFNNYPPTRKVLFGLKATF